MISGQSQRVRRNVSPVSTKQGPIRATVPVSLMKQNSSPPRNSSKSASNISPTDPAVILAETKFKQRLSPDSKIIQERRSRGSPVLREKSQTLDTRQSHSAPYIRRTASLDAIYLAGQWPRDAFYRGTSLMVDRSTQTPEEWDEADRKKGSQKNFVCKQLEKKYIRQCLQRTNQNTRSTASPSHLRNSPVQGDHAAISVSNSTNWSSGSSEASAPTSPIFYGGSLSPRLIEGSPNSLLGSAGNDFGTTAPIPVPNIPKLLVPWTRNSVEGLNQEIERLVLKGISGNDKDVDDRCLEPTPEGHRAPIADMFRGVRNVDTQTPSNGMENATSSSSSPESHSHSISPVISALGNSLNLIRIQQSSPTDDSKSSPEIEYCHKLASSPHINKFLTREPPDGCERVKIIDESRKPPIYSHSKPAANFILKPSQSSAFCPLPKNYMLDEDSIEQSK